MQMTVRSVLDPARDEVLTEVADATPEEVDRAIETAHSAFNGGAWARMPPEERGAVLERCAQVIRDHADDLALIDSKNVGKPIAQANGDAEGAAEFFAVAARHVATLSNEAVDASATQVTLIVREPVGVVAGILPWNYPVAIAAATLAPALAAGNSVVLKPSPETPLSAQRLGSLLAELLPAGVVQVVAGGADVGRQLTRHRLVSRIHFTGSTRAGEEVMTSAARGFKRIGLELGDKSTTMVFADAPLEDAAASAVRRFTANQGENCVAGSRLLVQDSIYDDFIARVVKHAESLVSGNPQHPDTDIGPMITRQHLAKVSDLIDSARRDSSALFEGDLPTDSPYDNGYFAPVAIFESPSTSRIWREEVFGPVLAVASFTDDADAIAQANDTAYGLMAHIWSQDRARAIRVSRGVRSGMIRVNNGVESAAGPWGGFGASGIGRSLGKYGIDANSELKQICLDIS